MSLHKTLQIPTVVMISVLAAGAPAMVGCSDSTADDDDLEGSAGTSGAACNNTCTTYPSSWVEACPDGSRCIEFKNSCSTGVRLSYQVGCDADGNPGAPQCNCTLGPEVPANGSRYWVIVDADDSSTCVPSVSPPCLTSGLAVMANNATSGASAMCSEGTRVEFTVGNRGNQFQGFDSYDIDVEKSSFTIPVEFRTDLTCTTSSSDLDCRPLYCDEQGCPDAFTTPTSGGCAGRSPAVGCQDTFNDGTGLTVEYCPTSCPTPNSMSCPSCQTMMQCGG